MGTVREGSHAPKPLRGMDTRSRKSLLYSCLETVHKTNQTCRLAQERTGEKGRKSGAGESGQWEVKQSHVS